MVSPLTSRLLNIGRCGAAMVVVVLLAGKLLHLNQECGCCGCGVHSQQAEKPAKQSSLPVRPCPFGCCHHHSDTPTGSEQQPEKSHDESQCPVCSVLAQAPVSVCIVSVPAGTDVVIDTVSPLVQSAAGGFFCRTQPRGPPSIA
ncbi:MAG: hypothetical protein KDA89_18575 [Planctomycetaceae bacterium]|nr:hypothetical protein [Planctomycetaceae bacterium]